MILQLFSFLSSFQFLTATNDNSFKLNITRFSLLASLNPDLQPQIFNLLDISNQIGLKRINKAFNKTFPIIHTKNELYSYWVESVNSGNINFIKSIIKTASNLHIELDVNIRQNGTKLNLLRLAASALVYELFHGLLTNPSFRRHGNWLTPELYDDILNLRRSETHIQNQFKIIHLLISKYGVTITDLVLTV